MEARCVSHFAVTPFCLSVVGYPLAVSCSIHLVVCLVYNKGGLLSYGGCPGSLRVEGTSARRSICGLGGSLSFT